MFPPLFDQDLSFAQAVEDLTVEQLVSDPAVEAFTISVLPRAARFDVSRLGANGGDPVSDRLGDKFRPIVRTYELGAPRSMNRSVRTSITSVEFSFRSTLIAKHSRLYSSRMFSVRKALPSSVRQ